MKYEFQLAGGSTIGRDHRLVPRNNQDSWSIWQFDGMTIGIVADGCGSGSHSEVGAQIGVQLIGSCIRTEYLRNNTINWKRVQQRTLAKLDILADAMGDNYRTVVEQYLLFTIVGIVLNRAEATFFAAGDGLIIVNGEQHQLGLFPGNMPPYLGYGLLPGELTIDPTNFELRTVTQISLSELETFMIATDGVDDLILSAQQPLPGMKTQVGDISQFWLNDRYFGGNTQLVSRQLKLVARDWPVMQPQPGLLRDDTTLIVGRRRPQDEQEQT